MSYRVHEPPKDANQLGEYLARELRRIEAAITALDLGVERRVDDAAVSGLAVRLGGVNDPALDSFVDGTKVYWFDNGDEVFFSIQMPHGYKEGSNLAPHVHWTIDQTATAATSIVWGLEYTMANRDGVFGPTNTIYGTAAAATVLAHRMTDLPEITAAAATISSILIGRLFRATADYHAAVGLLSADLHYTMDSDGSKPEHRK